MPETASDRDRAREIIGRTLTPPGGGGISGAFKVLETRLRQPYAQALTYEDRAAIREFINQRVDTIFELLDDGGPPAVAWPDDDDGADADVAAPAND